MHSASKPSGCQCHLGPCRWSIHQEWPNEDLMGQVNVGRTCKFNPKRQKPHCWHHNFEKWLRMQNMKLWVSCLSARSFAQPHVNPQVNLDVTRISWSSLPKHLPGSGESRDHLHLSLSLWGSSRQRIGQYWTAENHLLFIYCSPIYWYV